MISALEIKGFSQETWADFETLFGKHKGTLILKLRRGEFDEATVAVPKYLSDLGIKQIIPPLTTLSGQLWASLAPFNVILCPYVEGHNGFERNLSDQQWVEFGAALKRFHTADFPSVITSNIQFGNFSAKFL